MCSKLVRHLDRWEQLAVDTLRPLVTPSLHSGRYSPGPLGCLQPVVPLVLNWCLKLLFHISSINFYHFLLTGDTEMEYAWLVLLPLVVRASMVYRTTEKLINYGS